jgi:hypothetical protein
VGGAEVLEQQQPARLIRGIDLRHVHVAAGQQSRDPDVGRDVFLVGRRIHDDAGRAGGIPHAEIAPETGVGRGRLHAGGRPAEIALEPVADEQNTRVHT